MARWYPLACAVMVTVSAEVAEKARISAEKARDRRERYEDKWRRENGMYANRDQARERGERSHHAAGELKYRDYPFVMWDGEAPSDTGYSLFGSSSGYEICKPHLTTEECFDLLLQAQREDPKVIHFWFGGRYDWDEITRQSIPLNKLARLKNGGALHWHGYRLTEIEGKVYTIQKEGVSVRIFEVSGWFHSAYATALRNYGIGVDNCMHGRIHCAGATGHACKCQCTLCRIELGKSKRGTETYADIATIRRYMRDELALGSPLMNRIRKITADAGFDLRSWYGPSALAKQLLTRNKVRDAMAECPRAVNDAACYAFAGGRFEPFRGGIITVPLDEADENSAYMHAALDLPNLAKGQWRYGKYFEPGKFAVYHIKYNDKSQPFDIMKPQPLFRRMSSGMVCWPKRVEGWYWGPEAELVKDDPGATFIESWIFDEDNVCDRPFAFVRELYRKRLVLQSLPDDNSSKQAEMAFKWALASIYGQLCRIVGWDKKRRKPPGTHQLEWAGYITSKCRAAMHMAAVSVGESLISIDTDSVTAMCHIDVPEGKQLGEWKVSHYDGGVYYQSGVYFAKTGDKWSKGKTRGTERRQNNSAGMSPELLSESIRTGMPIRLEPRRKYITTRMALNGQLAHHGEWRNHPGNVLEFGGGGKRYHNPKFCEKYCSGSVHVFMPALTGFSQRNIFDTFSVPHFLPWQHVGNSAAGPEIDLVEDLLWVDTEAIDADDEWLAELVRKETA
jgi:hypothetical protein